MNVIFMGTPQFAVPTLVKLNEKGHNVALVVTQPDKPSGRGKKITKSEVKEKAEELNLNIFQPDRIKSPESVEILKSCKPDVIIVVAYGQILTKEILSIPKLGCINVHASLLPRLRGAAPLNWAVINGDETTGVTTMMMDEGLDTGKMLLKSEISIDKDMTAGQLHDIMMVEGADLLIKTLEGIEGNTIVPIDQDDSLSSYAPMLDRENTRISWNDCARNLHNLVRGLSPWPCAYFTHENNKVKVYRASYKEVKASGEPGYVLRVCGDGIYVACGDGILIIKEFQMPGKKKMDAETYLRGNKFPENIQLY